MKRRAFLITTSASVCGLIAWRFASGSAENAIVKVLQKRLSYLKLDEVGVRRFAVDLAAHKQISDRRLSIVDALGPVYTHLTLPPTGTVTNAIRWGEDRVVTSYLMSSDFFKNGADTNRTVQYLGFYDPLVACSNPFARPVIAQSAA